MKKGLFKRENIGKIVRLLPFPTTNGKPISSSRNSWLILQEYDEGEGIEVLNKITNHRGQIPYDSVREWREPDCVILSTQVNLGKDGLFEITPFLDKPDTEMPGKWDLARIIRLRITRLITVLGVIGLLWLLTSHWIQPPDRATINWVQLLWSGKKLSVDIGDLPEHARVAYWSKVRLILFGINRILVFGKALDRHSSLCRWALRLFKTTTARQE